MTRLLFGILIALIVSSCVEPPDFSNNPEISFKEIVVSPLIDEPGSNITITLNFQDGDGDLGLGNEDSTTFDYRFSFYLKNEFGDIVDVDGNIYLPISRNLFTRQDGVNFKIEGEPLNNQLGTRNLINLITNEKVLYFNLTLFDGENYTDLDGNTYFRNAEILYVDENTSDIFRLDGINNLVNISSGTIILASSITLQDNDFLHDDGTIYKYFRGNVFIDNQAPSTAYVFDQNTNILTNLTDSNNTINFSDLTNNSGVFEHHTLDIGFTYYNQITFVNQVSGYYYSQDENNNLINFVTVSPQDQVIEHANLSQDDEKNIRDLDGNSYSKSSLEIFRSVNGDYTLDLLNNLTNIETGEIIPSSKILNKYHYNYFIKTYKKEGNSFVQVLDGFGNLRFPKLFSEDNVGGALEGELELDYRVAFSNEVKNGDVLKFEIYIIDRNLNESNIIETEEIILGSG